MLRFRRVEVDGFVCFDNVVIEPSVEAERPLTVIRAENGSGKTTFLRALRWGMYGEKGLPGNSARYSLHPVWWRPTEEGIRTKVSIEFESDGSTRHTEGGSTTTVYQLVRSVTTIGKPAARDDEPDFRRINEQTHLMVKEGDGTWSPHTAGVDVVVDQLLPWELRDFFVMDADEATDFVGGSENKVMHRQEVIDKTTAAVHSLLGIDVFREASKRVASLARSFGAQATKAIGNADLDALQLELEQLRTDEAELSEKIVGDRAKKSELEDRLRQRRDDLESELKDVGAAEEIRIRLVENRKHREKVIKQRRATLGLLAGELESTDLLAALASSKIDQVYGLLRPLHERGHIPLKHLGFVRDLLDTKTCVCGQDLSEGGAHRRHVEDRVAESAAQEERANYLGQLHDAAKSLAEHAGSRSWDSRKTELAGDLSALEESLADLDLEKRGIDEKLKGLDEERIQIVRDEIEALETQVSTLTRNLGISEEEHSPLISRIDSLEKQIHQWQRRERAAADQQAAEDMANLVVDVLNRAYGTIQEEQVRELSHRMNRLFARMAANVANEDFDELERDKASLRVISEVGIRPVQDMPDNYEIYALNSRGRSMPPIEINGASRRVLALSFVLALCAESRTYAPLIADSLLNFMSGTVRRNTLKITSEKSSQPILLLTGSDLESTSEVETVGRYAGATYTLTGQWDAIDAGGGGDVVHWSEQRQVALLCSCGPREYCDTCEREGQAGAPGWSRRA